MSLPRTPMMLAMLEEALCRNHGDMVAASRACDVSYRHVTAWINADPEIAKRLKDAQMVGWAAIENAAYERAVKGVDKPIWHKGQIVGYDKQYSDGLLTQMMKARVPGYGETAGHGGMTVNVAIMPRANNYDEWVVQREKMLAGEAIKSIEHAPTVIDADFTEIKETSKLRDVL